MKKVNLSKFDFDATNAHTIVIKAKSQGKMNPLNELRNAEGKAIIINGKDDGQFGKKKSI